jgi:hypothetical protein
VLRSNRAALATVRRVMECTCGDLGVVVSGNS